ncbi:MAG TPA: hypothetical protein VLO00_04385 [Cryobacterium sp.]|nr:hypothetical protein [Cryobacterium sp.]
MPHTRDALSFRGGRRVFRSAILAGLTMAAMLLCLLAVHSAGSTGHGLGHGPGQTLSAAATGTAATSATAMTGMTATTMATAGAHSAAAHPAAHPAAAATAAVVALAAGAVSSADTHVMSGLAARSMTCSLLLVLGALILLSRRPAFCRQPLDAGAFVVDSFREIPLHLHRPSLTLLSISRI